MISIIPSGLFSGQKFLKTLLLNYNQLSALYADMFVGLLNLQLLQLKFNNISFMEPDIFNFPLRDPQSQIHLQGNMISEVCGKWMQRFKYVYLENNLIKKLKTGELIVTKKTVNFYLKNNKITHLQRNVFMGLSNLQYLDLQNNTLSFIETGAFNGLISLIILYLKNNKIQVIGLGTFQGLPSLKNLHLESNCIKHLPNGTFSFLSSLNKLFITDNNISEIDENAFSNLSVLKYLHLSNNSIGILHEETLKHMTQIYDIFLSFNELIEFRILSKYESLYKLNLSYNLLSTIDRQTFKGLKNINKTDGSVIIEMSFNQVFLIKQHSFLDCQFIGTLNLHHNNLTSICNYTFEGLYFVSEIDLCCNTISIIDGFGHLSKLESLDLSDNRLTEVHDLTFKYLYSLKDLFLSKNDIMAISNSAFMLKMLETLELQMNNIESMSWEVLYSNKSLTSKDNTDDWVKLNLSHNDINETIEHCWIKQGIEEKWIQTDLKNKELWNESKSYCPNSGIHYISNTVIPHTSLFLRSGGILLKFTQLVSNPTNQIIITYAFDLTVLEVIQCLTLLKSHSLDSD